VNKPRELDASLLEELRALLGERATASRAIDCSRRGRML